MVKEASGGWRLSAGNFTSPVPRLRTCKEAGPHIKGYNTGGRSTGPEKTRPRSAISERAGDWWDFATETGRRSGVWWLRMPVAATNTKGTHARARKIPRLHKQLTPHHGSR